MDGLLKIRIWNLKLRYQRATIELLTKDRRIIFMERREKIERMRALLERRMTAILAGCAMRQKSLEGQIVQLNPTSVLDRGFAIVFDQNQKIVRDADLVQAGQSLQVRVARGQFGVVADKTAEPKA